MWILNNLKNGRIFYIRPDSQKYTVGRNGDLQLPDDHSISRNHSEILTVGDSVYVKDVGSRYGTYVNENIEALQKITPNEDYLLKENDRVRFGRFENVWSLSKFDYKILMTSIAPEKKEKLKQVFQKLNFQVAETFDKDCTHLTTSQTAITTIKLIQALSAGIPIVTPNFWVDVYKAINANQALPTHRNYVPKVKETYIQLSPDVLQINENRKKLFNKKVFVFMNEYQMKDYQDIITLAGGSCINLTKNQIPKKALLQASYICIQRRQESSKPSNTQKLIDDLSDYLAKNNIRMIPETEIGSAILNCSLENCNPRKKFDENFKPNSAQLKILKSNVLVHDTENDQSLSTQNLPKPMNFARSRRPDISKMLDESKDLVMETEEVNLSDKVQGSNVEIPESQVSVMEAAEDNENISPPNVIPTSQGKRRNSQLDIGPSTSKVRRISDPPKEKEPPAPPKPQPPVQHVDLNSSDEIPSKPRNLLKKRNHDSDSEDDELFKFSGNLAKKYKIYQDPKKSKDIPDTSNIVPPVTESTVSVSAQQSLPVIRKPFTVTKTLNVTPIAKSLNSSGWLSKQFTKLSTGDPDSSHIKVKNEIDEESLEFKASKAFEVKFVHVPIKVKQETSFDDTTDFSMSTTRCNFKKFVKKNNYKPQNVVVPTSSVNCNQNASFGF